MDIGRVVKVYPNVERPERAIPAPDWPTRDKKRREEPAKPVKQPEKEPVRT